MERKNTAPRIYQFFRIMSKIWEEFLLLSSINQIIIDMNYKTFNLIDKINAEGLDNSEWGIYMHL